MKYYVGQKLRIKKNCYGQGKGTICWVVNIYDGKPYTIQTDGSFGWGRDSIIPKEWKSKCDPEKYWGVYEGVFEEVEEDNPKKYITFPSCDNADGLGIDKSRKFVVMENTTHKKGDIVMLEEDDESTMPLFKRLSDGEGFYFSWSSLAYADDPQYGEEVEIKVKAEESVFEINPTIKVLEVPNPKTVICHLSTNHLTPKKTIMSTLIQKAQDIVRKDPFKAYVELNIVDRDKNLTSKGLEKYIAYLTEGKLYEVGSAIHYAIICYQKYDFDEVRVKFFSDIFKEKEFCEDSGFWKAIKKVVEKERKEKK